MNTFQNRFDPSYRKTLLKRLVFDGEEGLIKTSVRIKKPSDKFPTYNKICKIDLCGIAASTLFDISGTSNKKNIKTSSQLYNVFKNVDELNKRGIILRLRLLFLYPYSEYAITRIQAETSQKRSSIKKKEFARDLNVVDDVISSKFRLSSLFRQQIFTLETIQKYIEEFDLLNEKNPNKIVIRFTPFGLNSCMFFINNTLFFDSYTLAKHTQEDRLLIPISPVTMINRKIRQDRLIYDGFEDHFRYLWESDTTMYCEDVTNFDKKHFTGLDQIKPPIQVSFDKKAAAFVDGYKQYKGNKLTPNELEDLEEKVNDWKFKMGFKLRKLTVNLRDEPSKEKLFIACSWHLINEQNRRLPNNFAEQLKEWLDEDFGNRKTNPCMHIGYVLADTGANLYERLYQDLQDATLAIILLTKDIETRSRQFYSRPNLYHELGYLIKQLEGSRRVMICYQEGVNHVSNVGNIAHVDFNERSFKNDYLFKVIPWLEKAGCYLNNNYIEQAKIRQGKLLAGI